MKESRCLARHPEYAVEYVNKDPGSNNMVTLASGTASAPGHEPSQMATEVLYDPSRPVPLLGLPIYIRHPLSLRPATANAVCVDDRLFLQTVYHAFHGEAYERDSVTYPADEDLEILSDTESEADEDDSDRNSLDETNSGTRDIKEGLKWLSYPNSPRKSHSRRSTFSSNASTLPPTIASPKHISHELLLQHDGAASNDGDTTDHEAAGIESNSAGPVNEPLYLNQSAQPPLVSLGRLVKSSALHDWALVEITNPIVWETLNLQLKYDNAQLLAYDKIARSPEDRAAIYTYTASGGRICGMLSPAPSFTRLPNTTSFQEIYIVRLDGSLATGDCGSAIIDCRTGDTYGHLVVGCKTTGTAHAVAAHQAALGFGHILLGTTTQESYTQPQFSRRKSPGWFEGRGFSEEVEFQSPAKPSTAPPMALYQRKHFIEGSNQHYSTSPTRFVKRWPQEFSRSRKPKDDRPYLESIIDTCYSRREAPVVDHAELFMRTDNFDVPSLDVRAAIRFMQSIPSQDLFDQWRSSKRSGTARLDDLTLYQPPAYGVTVEAPKDTYTEGSTSRNWTQSKSLQPRTYPTVLTAHELYCHLRERRFGHETLMDADRRLIYIADPDAYDMSALIKTATCLQRDSLRDAICAYLAQRTSIKATTSQQGYHVFQLEFHISYFALRRSRSSSLAQRISNKTERPHRGCINVDFLSNGHLQYEGEQETMTVYQAQISVTICGTNHSCWHAYCFEDRYFDDNDDDDDDDEDATNENDDKGPRSQYQLDKSTREESGFKVQDPREYFLCVLLHTARFARKAWEEVARLIEEKIRERSWSQSSATRHVAQSKRSHVTDLDFFVYTLEFLDKAHREVSRLNDAWGKFCGGDVELFHDTTRSSRIAETLHELEDEFSSLNHLIERLNSLTAQCDKRAEALRLRLITDSTKNAELTVYIISPFAIVSTFFAIPPSVLNFDRNFWSFLTAILLCILALHGVLFCMRSSFTLWHIQDKLAKRIRATWNGTATNINLHRAWRKISGRMRAAWNGDTDLTTTDSAGARRLRRRPTHAVHA
ncbi:hypothetical protein BKA63DRAFT_560567 [Paraphoma chrysanthemicola]|nr:hypothetical protein BKA63DRAFT_560567 [Paraphoma chrysanthemicola]